MKELKVIMLDFDGVIVESVGIKDRAFKDLFSGFPDKFDDIMTYHLAHNATVRFKKFHYIYEHILKKEYTDDIKEDLSRRFSDIVVKAIMQCPSVEGAEEFLETFYVKMPVYLISMTPRTELTRILEFRGVAKYFKDVYSADWKKVDAMNDILKKENVSPNQAVYIGDTLEDRMSAEEINVAFVGCSSGKSIGGNVHVCQDMREVKSILLEAGEEANFIFNRNTND